MIELIKDYIFVPETYDRYLNTIDDTRCLYPDEPKLKPGTPAPRKIQIYRTTKPRVGPKLGRNDL